MQGLNDGQFQYPAGIEVDLARNVYVADGGNNRVQKFDANGTLDEVVYGMGDGQFNDPVDVAISPAGWVYVLETHNDCVSVFQTSLVGVEEPRTAPLKCLR